MTGAEPAGTERRTAKADAMAFLQAALAGASVPATQVARMAHEHGLSPKAIRSAREALGVAIARNGFGPGGRSLWALPGGMDAPPPGPREGDRGQACDEVSASREEEPTMSEDRQPTIDGYDVIGRSDEPCAYCGERGGPVHPMHPQSGPVYLLQGLFKGVGRESLHEVCAGYWFEWYRALNKSSGQA